MQALIAKEFGDWQPQDTNVPPLPPVTPQAEGGVFFIERPQLTQSYIQMGHLGGMLDSPDYPALSVLNGVMNGFGGRLFNELRSRQGLAYSVYGYWSPGYDYPGVFVAGGQTRSDATVSLVRSMLAEIERLRREPISPEELAYAKDSVLNSFVFKFQTPSQTISRLMLYEYYGYPADFVFRYRQGVEATTIADVQRVAKKYLVPDKMLTLVVGNSAAIEPPLTDLGAKVTQLDISIPGA